MGVGRFVCLIRPYRKLQFGGSSEVADVLPELVGCAFATGYDGPNDSFSQQLDQKIGVKKMSWYVYNPKLSHTDWLRLRATERMIDDASRRNAVQIVSGSNNLRHALERKIDQNTQSIIGTIRESTDILSSSLNQISGQLDSISTSIEDFRADFNWWSEKQSAQLKTIEDILEKIRESLERRHRTEAFEFFAESREYVVHQMYEKALINIELAIHGDKNIRGYELEWRFWEHLGFLRLGDEKNNSQTIIDLKKAEEAFLMGAKLADREGAKSGAVRCLLGASQAAYCAGSKAAAISHAREARRLQPSLPEANWIYGRLSWEDGDEQAAEQAFFDALVNDHSYVLRFCIDPLFSLQQSRFKQLCDRLTEKLLRHQEIGRPLAKANDLIKICDRVSNLVYGKSNAAPFGPTNLEDTQKKLSKINEVAKANAVAEAAYMVSDGIVDVNNIISGGRNFLNIAKNRASEKMKELGSGNSNDLWSAVVAVFWFFYISCGVFIVAGMFLSEEVGIGNLLLLPFGVALGPLVMLFISGSAFNDPTAPDSARTLIVFFWTFAALGSLAVWHFFRRAAPGRNAEYQKMLEAVRIVDRAIA